ncbi:MAG: hypothetical protein ACYS0D_16295, partial [Planctomycetota bacterium]
MIYACEHHDEVLGLWRQRDLRGLRLAHVDFHDDLRGLLVDRRRRCAYPIRGLARGRAPVDAGNFLAHAVLDERLDRVRWVHPSPGGRAWDMGIVRYESDLFAWRDRLRHALVSGAEYALGFEEILLGEFDGLQPGEHLSVDWDCFASILQEPQGLEQRVEKFLERLGEHVPQDTYVAYSPEYSHPTLDQFKSLLDDLKRRFAQPIEWLSPGLAD